VISSLVGFGVRMALLIAGILFYLWSDAQALQAAAAAAGDPPQLSGVDPNWRIIFVPLFILNIAALGLGVGLIVSASRRSSAISPRASALPCSSGCMAA
jgi:hypothetical protein